MPREATIGVSLKLYFGHAQTLEYCVGLVHLDHDGVELFVIPSFTEIAGALDVLAGSGVGVGAQDAHWEDRGAFTGEVSPAVLAELGVRYVEVGHAERRGQFGDTDEIIARKVAAVQRHGMIPILCVGEGAGREEYAIGDSMAQLTSAARGAPGGEIIVAYEPVWAIGADVPASDDHIERVCAGLRQALAKHPSLTGRVIYGGSAGPGLLTRLGGAVDGLFLGRRAHDLAALAAVLDEARACNPGSRAGKTP